MTLPNSRTDALARTEAAAPPQPSAPLAPFAWPARQTLWPAETTGLAGATRPAEATALPAETTALPAEWPYGLPAAEPVPGAASAAQVGESSPYPTYPTRTSRELPIDGYDGLSLPSLRARLRNLDVAQLRQLVLYEISHAYRPDVVSMFERRIARLQGSDS